MQKTKVIISILLIIIAFRGTVAQPEIIDSLKSRVSQTSGEARVKVLIQLSDAYNGFAFDKCITVGMEAVELAKKTKDINLQAKAINSVGINYLYNGNLKLSIQYFKKSLVLYTNNNNSMGMAYCFNNIGLVYLERGNYTTAINYFQKKYDIVKALGDKQNIAKVLIQLGNVNYYRSNFQQSLDNYFQAMLIYSDLNDESGMADAYYSIAIIYSELKSFTKALDYYKKAEETYRKTGNKRDLSNVLNNMAKIYNFEYKDFKTAQLLYQQTLDLKKQLGDKIGIALLYNNLGTLFGNKKDYTAAMTYFNKSKTLYREIESESGLMMVILNIAEVYAGKGEIQHAVNLYKESLEMAKKNGEVSYINQNYEGLFYAYVQLNNYDEFDKYYRLFAIGKDTLIDRLNLAEIAEVEAKYKAEGLLREISNIQKDSEKKAKDIFYYRLLLAGISGLSIIFIVFYFLLYWKNRGKIT